MIIECLECKNCKEIYPIEQIANDYETNNCPKCGNDIFCVKYIKGEADKK